MTNYTILFFVIITGIYFVIGGLRAEIYVNTIHVLFVAIAAGAFLFWIFDQSSQIQFNLSSVSFIGGAKIHLSKVRLVRTYYGFTDLWALVLVWGGSINRTKICDCEKLCFFTEVVDGYCRLSNTSGYNFFFSPELQFQYCF